MALSGRSTSGCGVFEAWTRSGAWVYQRTEMGYAGGRWVAAAGDGDVQGCVGHRGRLSFAAEWFGACRSCRQPRIRWKASGAPPLVLEGNRCCGRNREPVAGGLEGARPGEASGRLVRCFGERRRRCGFDADVNSLSWKADSLLRKVNLLRWGGGREDWLAAARLFHGCGELVRPESSLAKRGEVSEKRSLSLVAVDEAGAAVKDQRRCRCVWGSWSPPQLEFQCIPAEASNEVEAACSLECDLLHDAVMVRSAWVDRQKGAPSHHMSGYLGSGQVRSDPSVLDRWKTGTATLERNGDGGRRLEEASSFSGKSSLPE
ncbi:hypothetical protein MLD38_011351 [Melastoma candidum]|uniref:Uncharacterized protein n=1 Tax=Melastoma candidum TaxID=119954 RepID=A0ACB9R2S7_9MYRT|nr:hypothetical protein MLD38_011351 [Melastoma candidum]